MNNRGFPIEKRQRKSDVYRFQDNCWKCGHEFDFIWVEHTGLEHVVGKAYATNIKRTLSKTQEAFVVANVCPKCEALQGNFYIFPKFANAAYQNRAEVIDVIEFSEEAPSWDICPLCNRQTHGLVTHHVSYDPPDTIEICNSCHTRIHATNGTLIRKDE